MRPTDEESDPARRAGLMRAREEAHAGEDHIAGALAIAHAGGGGES
jgi:hypothetical protein